MDDQTGKHIERSRRRSVAHVRRALETVRRVIEQNRQLAHDFPSHRESAEARMIEGEGEVAILEAELAALEQEPDVPGTA
jgi:hypothetical protein